MKRLAMLNMSALLLAPNALHGQTPAVCNNLTLKGAYGLSISGSRPAPSVLANSGFYLPGSIEQVIGVLIQTFDGNGNFTQTDNVKGSLSGIIFDRPGAGTYTINADCTGTFSLVNMGIPFPIVTRFVVVNGGAQFHAVVVSPQTVMVMSQGTRIN